MRKHGLAVLTLTALAISVIPGCESGKEALSVATADVKTVESIVIKKQSISHVSELSGTLEARDVTPLSFEVTGRILQLKKDEGSEVQKGEVLGQLEDADYILGIQKADAAIAQAQAALEKLNNGARAEEIEQARVQVEKAQINRQRAKDDLNKLKNLYESGAVSKDTYDKAVLNDQVAEQDWKAAQINLDLLLQGARKEDKDQTSTIVQQNILQKEQAELALQKTRLVSPISGTIISKMAVDGQLVNPGTPIYQIGNTRELKVVLPVPDREITSWAVGDKVTLELYGTRREGRVQKIEPSTNSGTGTIGVEVTVDNSDKKWVVGQVVKATHQVQATEGIFVPVEAVIRTGGANPYVFIVKNNKAMKQEVSVGRLIRNLLEIKKGLNEGDRIVTKGADRLLNGDTIQVVKGGETGD
jgi:multidrug efflux pump subunit AcrA (membrane-fusion protein)